MSLSGQVAKNTLIQISGKALSTVLGLFALALITRDLGLNGFGQYTTIITILTFFAVIADFGLTLVTVQMIGGHHEDEPKILNNLFSFRLVSSLVVLALAPLVVLFLPYGQAVKTGVLITALAFLFPALNQVIIGFFQKRLIMDRDSLAEIAGRLILIVAIIVSRKLGSGLNGVLIATVISGAVNFFGHYFLALRFTVFKLAFDRVLWRKIFHKSWPLTVTIVLNLIYLRADTLLLSLFRSAEEVGLYGAAYKIIDVLTAVPFMFAGLVLPILTASWLANDHNYFKKVLQKSFDFMAIVAVPLVIGAQFLGRPVMTFVAGRDFAASGLILQILIFAVAAIFLGTMFSHAVIALDKQKKMIGFYLFTSLSALLGYLILIPRFSYFGAAGVTIYSELLIAIFSFYCVLKYSRFRPELKTFGKSLIAGLPLALLLYFFPHHYQNTLGGLIFIIILAIVVYFLVLYLLGGIKDNDLKNIFARQKKLGHQTYDPTSNL